METYEDIIGEKPIIVPTREHSLLTAFIGKWTIQERNSDPEGNSDIRGVETYEWLPGGFFVVYRWDRHFATTVHKGLGMISHDEDNHTFSGVYFDNLGRQKNLELIYKNDEWHLTGQAERAFIKFDGDGNSFTENWEILDENNQWRPLYSLSAKRIS